MTVPVARRTFTESEILALKELTKSELTRTDTDTHAYETGSRRVRHVGSGPSVEEARGMNATIRGWGPLIAGSLRGDWIRDSRSQPLLAALVVSGTGALHFTKPVEPHVLDQLMDLLRAIDASPQLAGAIDQIVRDTWTVLSRDSKTSAGLPALSTYLRDPIDQVERFVAPLVRQSGAPLPYPRKVQASANLFFCATLRAIICVRKKALPKQKSDSSRVAALAKVVPVVRAVFQAAVAPASGAAPTVGEVEEAMRWVEARFAEFGTDYPKIFADLGAKLC